MFPSRFAHNRSVPALQELETRDLPSFLPPVSYEVGSRLHSSAVADFNGDGKRDVAVTDAALSRVAVMLGDGTGGLGAPATFATGLEPNGVRVADFNRDGKPDLVTANYGNGWMKNTVSVLLGRGDGTFDPKVDYEPGGLAGRGVAVGDLNGDGNVDIASTQNTSIVPVLLGNGDGTFELGAPVSVLGYPKGVAINDLDGDGVGDLTVDSEFTQVIQVYLSTGGTAVYDTGASGWGHAVGDVNKDGHLDLVVGRRQNVVSVLLGNGDGTFQPRVDFTTADHSVYPVLADFDRDRNLDIATVSYGASADAVSVLLGNGDGTFGLHTEYAVDLSLGLAAGDLNNDRYPDLVVAEGYGPLVHVLVNDGAWALPAPAAGADPGRAVEMVSVRSGLPNANARGRVAQADESTDGPRTQPVTSAGWVGTAARRTLAPPPVGDQEWLLFVLAGPLSR